MLADRYRASAGFPRRSPWGTVANIDQHVLDLASFHDALQFGRPLPIPLDGVFRFPHLKSFEDDRQGNIEANYRDRTWVPGNAER